MAVSLKVRECILFPNLDIKSYHVEKGWELRGGPLFGGKLSNGK